MTSSKKPSATFLKNTGSHPKDNQHVTSVHPEMVDFGSEQGLNDFETAGIACYFEDFERAKTQPWAKRCRFWMDTNYINFK